MLRSEFWPEPSAHRLYWEMYNCPHVYEYDPADDGPEVETITRILVSYPGLDPKVQSLSREAIDGLATMAFGLQTGAMKL